MKVRFSAEADSLPKISFVSEENVTALNTKPLKTSEQSSDSGKTPAKTNQNIDREGKPAKPDLYVLSLLVPCWKLDEIPSPVPSNQHLYVCMYVSKELKSSLSFRSDGDGEVNIPVIFHGGPDLCLASSPADKTIL